MSRILKPCPFCGGDGKIKVEFSKKQGAWYYSIQCERCFAITKNFKSYIDPAKYPELYDKAISKWNRRVDEE